MYDCAMREARNLLTEQGWGLITDGGLFDIVPMPDSACATRPIWYFSHIRCKILGLIGDRSFEAPEMLASLLELVQNRKRHCICKYIDVVFRSSQSPSWFLVKCRFGLDSTKACWSVESIEMQPSGEVFKNTFMANALNDAFSNVRVACCEKHK
jgi:hypothetical protein